METSDFSYKIVLMGKIFNFFIISQARRTLESLIFYLGTVKMNSINNQIQQ